MHDIELIQCPRSRVCGPGGGIRVLVWNVNSKSRSTVLLERIRDFDADIMLFQEMNADRSLRKHINKMGYGGAFVDCERYNWPPECMGSAVFSRFPFRETRFVELRRGRMPVAGKMPRRCYLEVEIAIEDDRTLTVGTAHLSPFGAFARRREHDLLVREVTKHRANFLFGGDLNVSPRSRLVRALNEDFQHLGPPLSEPSWPSSAFQKIFARRLDYAFGTPDVHVVDAHMVDGRPSDHRAIMLSVAL